MHNSGRMPNLATVLMVERVLRKGKSPIKIPGLKKSLSRQVMHGTLQQILKYLWESKKVEYTPDGIIWVFESRRKPR